MWEDWASKMNTDTGFKAINSFLIGSELKLELAICCVLMDTSPEKITTMFLKITNFQIILDKILWEWFGYLNRNVCCHWRCSSHTAQLAIASVSKLATFDRPRSSSCYNNLNLFNDGSVFPSFTSVLFSSPSMCHSLSLDIFLFNALSDLLVV